MPGRRGRPGLLGTVGRTAVIAGTATATANAVNRRAESRAAATVAQPVPAPPPLAAAAVPPPPVVAPPPPVADGQTVDLVTALSRLAQLRDSGALSEAEFQTAKTRLLA
jgi:hypothetical protein